MAGSATGRTNDHQGLAEVTDVPAERLSLGEAAYRQLRADIVSCRLLPGQWLTEKQLAAGTGFGSSPIRDALTRLDHDGLVRTLPRRGYQVTPMTPKGIDDLLDVWQVLGPELVRRGVAGATAEQKGRLANGFEAIASLSGEAPGHAVASQIVDRLDDVFTELAEATGNDYLIDISRRLFGHLGRIWTLVLSADPSVVAVESPEFWSRTILAEQDADAVAASARRTLARFREEVRRIVARWPSVANSEVVPPLPPR